MKTASNSALCVACLAFYIGMLDIRNDEAKFLKSPFKARSVLILRGNTLDGASLQGAYLQLMALEIIFFFCEKSKVIFRHKQEVSANTGLHTFNRSLKLWQNIDEDYSEKRLLFRAGMA